MPSIKDYVKSNFPETYRVLVENYPTIVDDKVSATLSLYFPGVEDLDEDLLTEFQRSYLADHATRLLIRPAIDFYGVRTGLSDDIDPRTASQTLSQRGPGTGRRNYDRIAMLRELDERLAASLGALEDEFDASLVPLGSRTAGLMISTSGGQLKSLDPQIMPSKGGSRTIPRLPPWTWSDWGTQDVTTWPP